jgi:hypothetical protein
MKTKSSSHLIVSLAAALLLSAPLANAKEWKDGGTGTYVTASSSSVKQANGGTVVHETFKGIVLSNVPGSIINGTSQTGSGTSVLDADGNLVLSMGYADGVDRDGDVFWIWWKTTPEGRTWGYNGGTGKFKGIKGGGTTTLLAYFPGDRSAISWEGTVSVP